MPSAKHCSFCGGRIEPGTGLMFVRQDGSISFYCSSKCERNHRLGRKIHKVRWTERARKPKKETTPSKSAP